MQHEIHTHTHTHTHTQYIIIISRWHVNTDLQLHQLQDLIYKVEARHARNYKTLHREDAVALCVKINDHTYLSG